MLKKNADNEFNKTKEEIKMSDADKGNFEQWQDQLDALMNKVFSKETWIKDHYKKPTLTPLMSTYHNFSDAPNNEHFSKFESALIRCKEAENTNVSDDNMPKIIHAAKSLMASAAASQVTDASKENAKKNSPR